MEALGAAQALAAALVVGLLVGLQRGWQEREAAEGGRVAGLRTFALIGLLGGVLGVLLDRTGGWPLAAALAGVAAYFAVSYRHVVRASGSLSATSGVAALVTLLLGVLAAEGRPVTAVAFAVVVALLLDLKPVLHQWLRLIDYREITAFLQLLVLSVVILPLLPDRGYGPYGAINPYRLWWAVILVAGLSLAGHLAMRWGGRQRGLLLTGFLGGLSSSTATTLALARQSRAQPTGDAAIPAAVLASCGTMFLRMAVLVGALRPALLPALGLLLGAMGAGCFAAAAWNWTRRAPASEARWAEDDGGPLFDLHMAVGFGILLAGVAVLTRFATDALGDVGLYAVAGISGLADVDAITISVLRMNAEGHVSIDMTLWAIVAATAGSLFLKAAMAWVIGGRSLGGRVAAGFLLAALAGALCAPLAARLF